MTDQEEAEELRSCDIYVPSSFVTDDAYNFTPSIDSTTDTSITDQPSLNFSSGRYGKLHKFPVSQILNSNICLIQFYLDYD